MVPDEQTRTALANFTDVSRETLDRLALYAELLQKWQPKLNLIGPSTVPDLWTRHFVDSAQIHPLVPPGAATIVDIGSGAGFPGLVLAILGLKTVHLVESDTRKAVFLREVARQTETPVVVHNRRMEELGPLPVDVFLARALAPLEVLLSYIEPYLTPNTLCIFHKGKRFNQELTEAKKTWRIRADIVQSCTDSESALLRLEKICRVEHHNPD